MLAPAEIRAQLGCGRIDSRNIARMLDLAHARGEAGRWPDGDFESCPQWTDIVVIERCATVADVSEGSLLKLYRNAHAEGLELWRRTTN